MTGTSIWDILGISETTDTSAIKSAYARRAKECHPEEHPEEFKELQGAYKAALSYAKNPQLSGNNDFSAIAFHAESDEKAAKESRAARPEKSAEETAPQFDYDEVSLNVANDRFFHEFYLIGKNPFLLNDKNCWDVFLKQEEYRGLFEDVAFRRNLVLTMCRYMSGWYRSTIRYFDEWLKTFEKDGEEYPPTEIKSWRRKRNRWHDKGIFSFPAWRISKEQREVHKLLLWEVQQECGEDNLEQPEVMRVYLEEYFSYANRFPGKMERLAREWREKRSALMGFIFWMVFAVLLELYLVVWAVNNPDKQRNYKEQRQQREEWVTPEWREEGAEILC